MSPLTVTRGVFTTTYVDPATSLIVLLVRNPR